MSDTLSVRSVDTAESPAVAPLHAVDELRVANVEDRFVLHASKRVDPGDPYLEGHFPSLVIYPGVFILETVRQAVALAVGGPADIVRLRSVRFLAPLFAGDTLTLEATVRTGPDGVMEVDARCERADGWQAARLRLDMERG